MLKKKITDGQIDTVASAWCYETELEKGISVGSYAKGNTIAKMLASVGVHNGQKKVIIDKTLAEKLGFKVEIV